MALQHRTAPYTIPRQRTRRRPPRGTEPADALSPLRTRFITAIAGIVFLSCLCLACAWSLTHAGHPRTLPVVMLVLSVLLLGSAVVDAVYLFRRARRELGP
jgi:uncharacterized membrane protein